MSTLPETVVSDPETNALTIAVGDELRRYDMTELTAQPGDQGSLLLTVANSPDESYASVAAIRLNAAEMRALGEYLVARSYAEERNR